MNKETCIKYRSDKTMSKSSVIDVKKYPSLLTFYLNEENVNCLKFIVVDILSYNLLGLRHAT